MAGCAIPTSSAGHAPAGAKTNPKLAFQSDHLSEAGQLLLPCYHGNEPAHFGKAIRVSAIPRPVGAMSAIGA
jgi:hypothetical protein